MQYAEAPLRFLQLGHLWERYCGNLRVDCSKLIAAGWHPVYDTRTGIAKLTENSGAALRRVRMIPKSGNRFSEKIRRKRKI